MSGEFVEVKLKDFVAFHDFNFIYGIASIYKEKFIELCKQLSDLL